MDIILLLCRALLTSILILIICVLLNILLFTLRPLQKRFLKTRLRIPLLKCLVGSFFVSAAAFLVLGFYYERYRVVHEYLSPTLLQNDMVSVKKTPKDFIYNRGQLIIYKVDGTVFTTRVIAESGDKVFIKNEEAYVNGERLVQTRTGDIHKNFAHHIYTEVNNDEKYKITRATHMPLKDRSEFTVPDGKVFCMLDARYVYSGIEDNTYFEMVDKFNIIGYVNKIICSFEPGTLRFRENRFMINT
jgi:signal peptidase I